MHAFVRATTRRRINPRRAMRQRAPLFFMIGTLRGRQQPAHRLHACDERTRATTPRQQNDARARRTRATDARDDDRRHAIVLAADLAPPTARGSERIARARAAHAVARHLFPPVGAHVAPRRPVRRRAAAEAERRAARARHLVVAVGGSGGVRQLPPPAAQACARSASRTHNDGRVTLTRRTIVRQPLPGHHLAHARARARRAAHVTRPKRTCTHTRRRRRAP